MEDKKSEMPGSPEAQSKPACAVGTDAGFKTEAVNGQESPPALTLANSSRSNGASVKGNGATAKGGTEKTPAADDSDQSLGAFLIAARERRGLAAEDVVRETRLPSHYLRMMESNDYSRISDQLYLVPFLRRYASFLELDQEDVAMRFVREVQRSDSIPPARLDQPLVAEPRRARGWTGAIVVIGFLTMAAGVYLYESDRHRKPIPNDVASHADAGAVAGSDSTAANVPQTPASH